MAAADLGAAELITLVFPGERAHPGVAAVLAELAELAAERDIRVLDLVFVTRTAGDLVRITGARENLRDSDLGALQISAPELISEDDLGVVREWLRAGMSAAVITCEHSWARRLARAVRDAGGMVMISRSAGRGAGTVVAMVSDHRSRIRMPTAALGAGGPVVSRVGLGLAALGRPAYITSGREQDLPDRSVAGLRARTFSMLDAAYAAGVRYVDAARSYGRAEEFLAGWLAERGHADVIAGSKWGYRYTGGWRLDAPAQEVKEHSLAMFTTQLAQSRALLGDRLTLYQVHSLTLDSGLFTDAALLAALSRLRAEGVIIGLSATGPRQAETIRRALSLTVDGQQLFTATEVTWNLLEPSVGPAAAEAAAAGWAILVKEAVANGRLTSAGGPPALLTALAAARGLTEDAIALAAALAQPWASVVLSGAVTRAQLDENLAALTVGQLPALNLAEAPDAYWAQRAARPWH